MQLLLLKHQLQREKLMPQFGYQGLKMYEVATVVISEYVYYGLIFDAMNTLGENLPLQCWGWEPTK